MRLLLAASLLALSTVAVAQSAPNPVNVPTKLNPEWQAKTRNIYKTVVEIPTVAGRNEVPKLANYIADQFKSAGWDPKDIAILPYEGDGGDKTVALVARWRADKPTAKPIMLMAHMDVVEAKRADWQQDPFEFIEKDGYFYGRGTGDNKAGLTGVVMSLLKLKAAGFKPKRDLVVFFTGDEETGGNGARLGSTQWRDKLDVEFALNSDGGGGSFTRTGMPLGYGLQTAEKTYQSYQLTVRNKGGHSSRPRPDNAIYELATALKKIEAYRFEPKLNETTRGYFAARAKQEGDSELGKQMRAWLANENDQAAADAIEANELEVGLTRTRCVATRLEGGHADNALPQMARATINCRILPGVETSVIGDELKSIVGPDVTVEMSRSYTGRPTPVSPLRPDVVKAYTDAVQAFHGKTMDIIPVMSTGASDGAFFREVGIPVYGVDGSWGISPDDERAHGLDERMPVRAIYDNVLFWEMMLKALAGK